MKTYTLLFILAVLFTAPAYSQTPVKKVKKEVANENILRNWKTGKTKTFFGQKITKLSKDDGTTRTNIVFWPVAGKGEMVRFVSSASKNTFENTSGKIAIFLDRQTENEANTQWYTVSLQDEKGNELHTTALQPKQPTYFMANVWYNYLEVIIPLDRPVFNVVITDNLNKQEYKYRVSANLDGIQPVESNEVATLR